MFIPSPEKYKEEYNKAQNLLINTFIQKIVTEMNRGSNTLYFDVPENMSRESIKKTMERFADQGWKVTYSDVGKKLVFLPE